MSAPPGYRIRTAVRADAAAMVAIERLAGERFREVGLGVVADGFFPPIEDYLEAIDLGPAWIVETDDGTLAGFVLGGTLDGVGHLIELDVHPDHGRRGIGRALVAEVLEWARSEGLREVVLTTFREVPFNGPFYRSLGFIEFVPGPERRGLLAARAHEAEIGFDAASPRVAMRRVLGPAD